MADLTSQIGRRNCDLSKAVANKYNTTRMCGPIRTKGELFVIVYISSSNHMCANYDRRSKEYHNKR